MTDIKIYKEQNDYTWKLFFYCTGASTLFIWSSILAQSNYWKEKVTPNVTNYYTFYWLVGGLVGFLLSNKIAPCFSFQTHIYLWPTCMIVSLYAFLVICECLEGSQFESLRMVLFLGLVCVNGAWTNILALVGNRYAMCFSYVEISSNIAGGGFINLFCSLLALMFSYIPVSSTTQFCIYLAYSTILYLCIVAITYKYMQVYVHCSNLTAKEEKERDEQLNHNNFHPIQKIEEKEENDTGSYTVDWHEEIGYTPDRIFGKSHFYKSIENQPKTLLRSISMKEHDNLNKSGFSKFLSMKTLKSGKRLFFQSEKRLQIAKLKPNDSNNTNNEFENTKDNLQPFYISVESPEGATHLVVKASTLQIKIRDILLSAKAVESWSERNEAWKQTYTLILINFWTNVSTMAVFPALMFIVGLGMPKLHA